MQSEQLNYIPIFMQLLLAVGFVAGTIFVSGKLGPKRTSQSKDKNFECKIFCSSDPFRIIRCGSYFLIPLGNQLQRIRNRRDD